MPGSILGIGKKNKDSRVGVGLRVEGKRQTANKGMIQLRTTEKFRAAQVTLIEAL